jgi:hypothetical protein
MLSPDQLELLTAAVDGELPPRRARRLRRLLAASAEARTVLARLEADAARLRNLPKAAPPADLAARIMAKVAVSTPPVVASPARPATVPFRRRQWVHVAVAASLLLGVGVSSFLFFVRGTGGSNGAGSIAHNGGTDRHPGPIQIAPEIAQSLPSEHDQVPPGPIAEVRPQPRVVAHQDTRPATAPDPRPKADRTPRPDSALGAPLLPDVAPLDRVQVRLPFLAGPGDLDRDEMRAALAEELGREHASRVDVFVKDPARGVELLQAAARSVGLVVHADAATAARVRTRAPTTAFVLFTESLTAAEARDLLARFAADDAKASAKVFDTMHVTPLHPADHRDLNTNVFGFDVSPAKKANGEPRPISAGTADQVAKNVGRGGEKAAALATYLPSTARTAPMMSRELKQFADRRADRKPNTTPVVIVVRYAGN